MCDMHSKKFVYKFVSSNEGGNQIPAAPINEKKSKNA